MTAKIVENERTAMAQKVTSQRDGPGLRIGRRSEISLIFPVIPGSVKIFCQRLPQFQAEAAYWQKGGTVHDFVMFMFDNDTRIFMSIVYDGNFKPYLDDIINKTTQWFDPLLLGVVEGFKGTKDPGFSEWLSKYVITAEFFYVSYPDATRRDVVKGLRVQSAFEHLLDEAQS